MEYGVNVSNKFAFLGDDEDAHDPAEILARAQLAQEKEKAAALKAGVKKPLVAQRTNVAVVAPSANKENVDVRRNQPRKDGPFRGGAGGGGGYDRKDNRGPRGPRRDDENHTAPTGDAISDRFGESRLQRPPRNQNYERRNNNADGAGHRGGFVSRGGGTRPEGGNRPEGGWQRTGGDREHRPPRQPRNETSGGENNAVSDGEHQPAGRGGNRFPRGARGGGTRGDRNSGSDRTGVRPVVKKDGFGKGNWGTDKDDLAGEQEPNAEGGELNKSANADGVQVEGQEHTENANAEVEGQEPEPEEEKIRELTLEEWRAERKEQKPQFNVRKPNEGGDQKIYQKLVLVKPVTKDEENAEEEEDASLNKREPREKPLNIEVSFSDSQRNRGGRDFREDRGDRRDFRGGDRGDRGNNFERSDNRRSGGFNDRGGARGGGFSGPRRNDGPGGSGTGGRRPQNQGQGGFNLTAESFPALGAR